MIITNLIGCGSGDEQIDSGNKEIALTGELAPVASFYDINLPLYDNNLKFEWCGDHFVYLEREWNKELGYNTCTLYKVPADSSGEAIQIHQSTTEDFGVWNYTMDEVGNLYALSWKRVGETKEFRLCKYDVNMQEILCVEPDTEQLSIEELGVIQEMYVDNAGRVILADWESNLYFFDENLNFVWKETLGADFYELNFVDAGEQGSFFARFDQMTSRVSLLKIDYEKQCMEALPEINMSNYLTMDEYLQIVSGGEYGVLLSTNKNLFKCNLTTGEVEPWFDWKDTNLNIYGETVKEIKFHAEGDEIFMTIWCYDWRDDTSEIAEISYVDKAYLPEKQTVVLGTMVYSDVEKWVDQFNRNNRQYIVEIKEYESTDELVQAFLFGKDEIPDILDISVTSSSMLDNKGILEDLEPYFKKSNVVNKEDILEPIWDMCKEDGKVTSIITQFYFQTCVTSLDTISEDGWTIEEFFSLEDKYPESSPLQYYKYNNVIRTLGDMGFENFIDWDKKKSDFDSTEFISLIEEIKSLDLNTNPVDVTQEEETINALLAKDFLLNWDYYRTPYAYRRLYKKYRGCVKNVGFPTSDGEPYYRVYPDMQFSIYSGSEKKEGAWAFIEFLLSEEAQTWYGDSTWAFPVRQDAYEEFLTKPHSAVNNYVDDDPNIDTYTVFMNMIEHAHLAENNNLGTISSIINEELQAYFENAKTAEETAEIIQSRVQLYLDENY
ncbi:MAG: extracellular solute-binding protein [Roseburia sp.]|nr:extracellular solute-binding protein [Roseburia sp.]